MSGLPNSGSPNSGSFTTASVDFAPKHTAVIKPIEQTGAEFEDPEFLKEKKEHPELEDVVIRKIVADHKKAEMRVAEMKTDNILLCDEVKCTCVKAILDIKSVIDSAGNPNFDSVWDVTFVGCTDAPSNGQRFDSQSMYSIANKTNDKIQKWKDSGKKGSPIPIIDKSTHDHTKTGETVGWIERLNTNISNTPIRPNVTWWKTDAKTFDPDFNRRLYYDMVPGWSVGFKHLEPKTNYLVDGIKVTQDADIVHWVASLDPADEMARTINVSAKTEDKTETLAIKTKEGEDVKLATEEEEKKLKAESEKKKSEEEKCAEEEKKRKAESEKKKAEEEKKTMEIQAKELELKTKEVELELKSLTLDGKITPAQVDKIKTTLTSMDKVQRDAIYSAFEVKTAIPAELKKEEMPVTVEKVEGKSNPATQKAEIETKTKNMLQKGDTSSYLAQKIGKPKKKVFDSAKGKYVYEG